MMETGIGSATESGRLLAWPPFQRYWLSRLLGQTSQAALLYALLILIVDQTQSGIWSSLFVVCSILPSLVLGLLGGAVADILPQRWLMIVLNVLRAGLVSLLIFRDTSLTMILIVTLGIWSVHQFYSPAESALVGRLVETPRLANATSLYNLALSLAQIIGMVLLAPLLLKLGPPEVLLSLCVLLYVAASVALAMMGQIPPLRTRPLGEVGEEMNHSLRQGWRFMVRDRISFAALVDSVLLGIGLSSLVVIVPQYLEQVLSTGAGNTVYVFAPAALGLVLGLQVAPPIGAIIGHGRLATLGLIGFAVCILGIGLVGPLSGWLENQAILVNWLDSVFGLPRRVSTTMLIALPAGVAMAQVNVAARTVLLERVPEDTRARAFATQMLLANLGALAPTLMAGVLIDVVGVEPVAILFSVALVVGAILARRIGGDERNAAAPVVQ